jgi:hypothetical protein
MGSTLFTTPNETIIYGGTWEQNPIVLNVEDQIMNWFYTNTKYIWDDLEQKGLIQSDDWKKYWILKKPRLYLHQGRKTYTSSYYQ